MCACACAYLCVRVCVRVMYCYSTSVHKELDGVNSLKYNPPLYITTPYYLIRLFQNTWSSTINLHTTYIHKDISYLYL